MSDEPIRSATIIDAAQALSESPRSIDAARVAAYALGVLIARASLEANHQGIQPDDPDVLLRSMLPAIQRGLDEESARILRHLDAIAAAAPTAH